MGSFLYSGLCTTKDSQGLKFQFLLGDAKNCLGSNVSYHQALSRSLLSSGGVCLFFLAFASFSISTTCQVGHFESHLFWFLIEFLLLTGGRCLDTTSIFLMFCDRMDVGKSQRVPPFSFFRHCEIFSRK